MLRCIASSLRKTAWTLKYAGLKEHAKYELERAGLFSKESDYEGLLGEKILELCECFAKQGHSGFSASMAVEIFNKLAQYQTLTPLTSDPQEWENVSHYGAKENPPMWQNKRDPAYFSKDGGKTWYNVADKEKSC